MRGGRVAIAACLVGAACGAPGHSAWCPKSRGGFTHRLAVAAGLRGGATGQQQQAPWWGEQEASSGRRGKAPTAATPPSTRENSQVPLLATEDPSRPWWGDDSSSKSSGLTGALGVGLKPVYLAVAAPVLLLLGMSSPDSSPSTKSGSKPKAKPQKPAKQQAAKPAAAPPVKAVAKPASPSKARAAPGVVTRGRAQLRAAGVLLAIGATVAGFRQLQVTNALTSSWAFPYAEPWQVVNLVTFLVNYLAVHIPGRLDGRQSLANSDARFFAPAGWAFIIWAPIFLGEFLFVVYQALPLASVRSSWWLAELSPWFGAAMVLQTLWCAAFRPWTRAGGLNLQWCPALLLSLTAVALGGVHGILVQALEDSELGPLPYVLAFVPLALHFGWMTAASLVNWNGYVAAATKPKDYATKATIAVASVYAGCAVGITLTVMRRDPIYAAVLAWALAAVADERGWSRLRGQADDSLLQLQSTTAKAGSLTMLATAAAPLALQLVRFATQWFQ